MWIITKNGFISVVKHNARDDVMRVRARCHDHLAWSFPEFEESIIDHSSGEIRGGYDYKYHVDIPTELLQEFLTETVNEIDYVSHAKEAMSKRSGHRFYSMLMKVWSTFMPLQNPVCERPALERSDRPRSLFDHHREPIVPLPGDTATMELLSQGNYDSMFDVDDEPDYDEDEAAEEEIEGLLEEWGLTRADFDELRSRIDELT